MNSLQSLSRACAQFTLSNISASAPARLWPAGWACSATPCSPLTTVAITQSSIAKQFKDAAPAELRQLQPYTRAKRPKPWPEILLNIELNAARNRPANKNRLKFDRQLARQIQIAKDAWKRKENKWKNEQGKRADAEKRWALRAAMAKAESNGEYLFEAEYSRKVQKQLKRAQYRTPKRTQKRKSKRTR